MKKKMKRKMEKIRRKNQEKTMKKTRKKQWKKERKKKKGKESLWVSFKKTPGADQNVFYIREKIGNREASQTNIFNFEIPRKTEKEKRKKMKKNSYKHRKIEK